MPRRRVHVARVAHFGSDDRQPRPCSPAACRFDSGVEREQIRLERDLVDDADDLGDLAAGIVDLAHRVDGLLNDLSAAIGLFACTDAKLFAARALSALRFTVADISSMLAAGFLERCSPALATCADSNRRCRPDSWRDAGADESRHCDAPRPTTLANFARPCHLEQGIDQSPAFVAIVRREVRASSPPCRAWRMTALNAVAMTERDRSVSIDEMTTLPRES